MHEGRQKGWRLECDCATPRVAAWSCFATRYTWTIMFQMLCRLWAQAKYILVIRMLFISLCRPAAARRLEFSHPDVTGIKIDSAFSQSASFECFGRRFHTPCARHLEFSQYGALYNIYTSWRRAKEMSEGVGERIVCLLGPTAMSSSNHL